MLKAAYYQASLRDFLSADPQAVLGHLTAAHGFALEHEQRDAWRAQVAELQRALNGVTTGYILFEFTIPRMGKRADVVLFIDGLVIVIEFKVGAAMVERSAINQVHDYALDLKNFHLGSHCLPILPVILATRLGPQNERQIIWAKDDVAAPVGIGPPDLIGLLRQVCCKRPHTHCDFQQWITSGYQPTPTIIEAAQALYQAHGVEEIARSDAGAQNLSITSAILAEVIESSKAMQRKSICMVTGVPGAGKTLAGLNIATKRARDHSDENAVFLSGNGPLVDVLREALARDESQRLKVTKDESRRKVVSFIQNIHHFRDDALRHQNAPFERVVIFDEAQRAWTREQATKFMQTKRSVDNFGMSEPEFLISVMDRHHDWCVVICLIGGGQEINTGEAGISEWLTALSTHFQHWDLYISDRLLDADYVSDPLTTAQLAGRTKHERQELHLATSMRSFRAETLSSFIGHVIENRPAEAKHAYALIADRYPIKLTRHIDSARTWLRQHARGTERYGILASSGGLRLRPEGIHVKAKVDPPVWFLNGPDDVRSSFYCEEVATEFDVQGLELDWAAVCWDADFRYECQSWGNYGFSGTRWGHIKQAQRRVYQKNAYRVILTRARQGMIIFVPFGDEKDTTRLPKFYDSTFEYLKRCGLSSLDTRP